MIYNFVRLLRLTPTENLLSTCTVIKSIKIVDILTMFMLLQLTHVLQLKNVNCLSGYFITELIM